MLARLPSLSLFRLWAALLLAVIGLQASLPAPNPEKIHGPAFSAATYEVALVVQRSERAKRELAVPSVLPTERLEPISALSSAIARQPAAQPDSTGPPTGGFDARIPAPRGPPRA